jgi:hypothetical protein
MAQDVLAIARASYEAYAAKDRGAIEALIADDFHFTSPLDNRIDRETYFARCWPNSATIAGFDFIYMAAVGDRAFVTYEGPCDERQAVSQYGSVDDPRRQNHRGRSLFRLVDPARGRRGRVPRFQQPGLKPALTGQIARDLQFAKYGTLHDRIE